MKASFYYVGWSWKGKGRKYAGEERCSSVEFRFLANARFGAFEFIMSFPISGQMRFWTWAGTI